MDNMKQGASAQEEQHDAAQNDRQFRQYQGFSGGWGYFGGFPDMYGYGGYWNSPGRMEGMSPDGMNMEGEAFMDGWQCRGMSKEPFPADSLTSLLMQSNHGLFTCLYMGSEIEDVVFSGLTDQERTELKEILKKLIASWNEKMQSRV